VWTRDAGFVYFARHSQRRCCNEGALDLEEHHDRRARLVLRTYDSHRSGAAPHLLG